MKIREFDAALERWIPFDFITGWENSISNLGQLSLSPIGAHMKGILRQNG